jgi:hypothetical protein
MSRAYVNPLARRQPAVVASARAIKAWTRELLALDDDVVVSVNELSCALPDCPPTETVILLMFPGQPPVQGSVHKAMCDVTHDDIAAAFEQVSASGPRQPQLF